MVLRPVVNRLCHASTTPTKKRIAFGSVGLVAWNDMELSVNLLHLHGVSIVRFDAGFTYSSKGDDAYPNTPLNKEFGPCQGGCTGGSHVVDQHHVHW